MDLRHPILCLVLGVTAACGRKRPAAAHDPCDAELRKDVFAVGLHKRGVAGALELSLIASQPTPPARGDNVWTVQVRSIATGNAVNDATVTATPFMPDHGHGTPIKVNVTAAPVAGEYQLAPINLWMPGYWEVAIHAAQGTTEDSAVFKLCIAN